MTHPLHTQALVTGSDKKQDCYLRFVWVGAERSWGHPPLAEEKERLETSNYQSLLFAKTDASNADLDKGLEKKASGDQDRLTLAGEDFQLQISAVCQNWCQ